MNKAGLLIRVVYACLFSILLIGQILESFGVPLFFATAAKLFFFTVLLFSYYQLFRLGLLKFPSGFMKYLIIAFFIYSLIIICRGNWILSSKMFLSRLVDIDGAMIYLLPMIIIPLPNLKYIKQILRVAFYFSLLTIPLWILNTNYIFMVGQKNSYLSEGIGMWMPYLSAFLLPLRGVLSKRERIVNFSIYIFYFVLMLLNARRNVCLSFTIFTIISVVFISRQFVRKKILSKKAIIFSFIVCMLAMLISIKPLLNGPFSFLKEKGLDNSRSGVEALFFADMLSSPVTDWIYGRGMDGTYEQIIINEESGDVDDSRQVIETGYLNIILKGGILYVFFIFLFIVLGIRRNLHLSFPVAKYFVAIICVYILDLYTSNPICMFSPRSILFWLLVSL